jgi:hypothetical protein
LFAADCVRAITGVDPAASYRGHYASQRGARAVLRRHVGAGLKPATTHNALSAAWTAALGTPLAHPYLAQRGDVVLVDTDAGAAAGVVVGGAIAAAGPVGLIFLPLRLARRAWRV